MLWKVLWHLCFCLWRLDTFWTLRVNVISWPWTMSSCRVQRLLDRFTQRFNFHSVSTERNGTPRQLWASGCLRNFNSPNAGIRDVLDTDNSIPEDMDMYGHDPHAPLPDPQEDEEGALPWRKTTTMVLKYIYKFGNSLQGSFKRNNRVQMVSCLFFELKYSLFFLVIARLKFACDWPKNHILYRLAITKPCFFQNISYSLFKFSVITTQWRIQTFG